MTARRGLVLDGVSASRGRREVLSDVSIDVPPGGWLAVIGPNGAGKTTALHAMAGLVAYRGEISWDATPLRTRTLAQRARLVAVVVQEPQLPPEMTVGEYALLGRRPYLSYLARESAADRAVVADVLHRLDLGPYARRRLGALSGGERQRVVLARALAQEPAILVLDEPTSALDLGRQQQALELLDGLRRTQGLTVVTALHDLTLAGQFADLLVLLREGRTIAAGPPDAVLTEATLVAAYGAAVRVVQQPDGTRAVLPVRSQRLPMRG